MYLFISRYVKWFFNASQWLSGWSIVSNTWKLRAPCYDGEGPWSHASAHVKKSRVSQLNIICAIPFFAVQYESWSLLFNCIFFLYFFLSRHGEKYVRKSRLDWPDGAASRDSIKAVLKLPRLQVSHCICSTLHMLYNLFLLCVQVTQFDFYCRT